MWCGWGLGHVKKIQNASKVFRRIKDLSRYVKEFNGISGVKQTVNLDLIKRHYYMGHQTINPSRVVPLG